MEMLLNGQCQHGIPLGDECKECRKIVMTNKAAIHEPDPIPGDKIVLELVMKDLNDRAEIGKEKYGTYLMTNNGRDALMDAYQEALDFVMYLRQAVEERKTKYVPGDDLMNKKTEY